VKITFARELGILEQEIRDFPIHQDNADLYYESSWDEDDLL
jgi:hypothetical protein